MATRTPISEAPTIEVERLRAGVRGPVILPADPGYDAARAIWNGAIDRRPACIARCTGVADVVAAVGFARERDLLVAVRSGGHGVGWSERHRHRRNSRSRAKSNTSLLCGRLDSSYRDGRSPDRAHPLLLGLAARVPLCHAGDRRAGSKRKIAIGR